jgi:NifB/MoaA-like Fe-S oxidoreductase
VENEFFGGNTAVTGLMVGSDINRVLANCDADETIFLPDVCLSGDRFLDGLSLKDLIRPVKIVRTDGRTLKRIIEA